MAIAKPALKKPTVPAKPAVLAKPAAAAKGVVAKPVKAAAVKPPKEVKPFEDGEIVVFKGYAEKGENQNFVPDQRLAVVGQREEEGKLMVACVAEADYHKFKADEDSVNGEELMPSEVKRTGKSVEAPYQLPVIGEMSAILKSEGGDAKAQAQKLFGDIEKGFFYLGGVLAKLWKERDEETGKPLFATYAKEDGGEYATDTEGFDDFLRTELGGSFGGSSKAKKLIAIYETFSSLKDAAKIVKELSKVGWWKASQLASYVTNDNAEELVAVAQEQGTDKLAETLKSQYTSAGSTPQGKTAARATIKKITFGPYKLFEDQAEGVAMIIKSAAKQTGITDPNALFEHMVTEWATDHLAEVAEKAKVATEKKAKALDKAGIKRPAAKVAA